MTGEQLKQQFFEYFKSKNHSLISSASLIPDNDPTVLFTTAGMHPLVPYLLGQKHPEGTRLVDVQKCLRTGDIDEVGDTTHHTFFEMLGNWSLGDYFKEEAVRYSWEFLTEVLKLDKEKLAVSIFGGNDDVPEYDKESEDLWLSLGMPKERIARISDNWWGPAGQTGPCGPDTEMFFWTGQGPAPETFNEDDDNWVEIWNDVLMEYNKTSDGKYEPLEQKNIDTGMGLERTVAVLNGLDDNYLTDLFLPIIQKIEELSGKKYEADTSASSVETKKSFRIVADHIRTAVFVLGDHKGVTPSNKDQGYVLRRLIRRAIRFAKKLEIHNDFCKSLAEVIINKYQEAYPELKEKQEFILDEISKEEIKFKDTLEKGLKEFNKEIIKINTVGINSKTGDMGELAFYFYETFGFPIEMFLEEIKYSGIANDPIAIKKTFNKKLKEHQELSQTASAGMFKGGLADDGEMTVKHHTAAHLMLEALRRVLGDHVQQKGSNINEKRLRFDFSHPEKLTDEEKQKVTDLVNKAIQDKLPVHFEEMPVDEAKEIGATGVFDHKYGEKVKVYFVGNDDKDMFSKEICGGPHVAKTDNMGTFRILKESSSSAGVRRIKAVLE